MQPGFFAFGSLCVVQPIEITLDIGSHSTAHLQVCKGMKQARDSSAVTEGQDGVTVHESLLSDSSMCEHFVGLLCQFEPAAVLPFLQSYDSYRWPSGSLPAFMNSTCAMAPLMSA